MARQIIDSSTNSTFNSRIELTAFIVNGYYKSGKGTVTNVLSHMGYPVFETGLQMKVLAKKTSNPELLNALNSGKPVPTGFVLNTAKQWLVNLISNKATRNIVILDGLPRQLDQLPILQFLLDRGYRVMSVWFTTPEDVCDQRPDRIGRFEDISPTVIQNRRMWYRNETLPVKIELQKGIIHQTTGIHHSIEMHEIDNSGLTKEQTLAKSFNLLGINASAAQMIESYNHSKPISTVQTSSNPFELFAPHMVG